ncbi:hypothetical protein J437_LFUL015580 [Ladona fulva]|uniref:GRAM domain-containing protein n=1 Tax=Ladona fulva TaxID=123851 RepID=A0A8K0P7I1_LADFU|nr:hypothetical protein J437_LFUL015580 [Ladona fulva]
MLVDGEVGVYRSKMSLNTAHANGGVLIHAGEVILLFCNNVTVEFHGNDNPAFKGSKSGRMYLTTHRMIFNHKDSRDPLQSFSFPFVTISEVELEQPVFGANFIKGKVRAQPNGNWIGEVKFKLMFKSGGAIDFGQAMLKAAQMASGNGPPRDAPPPYTPPTGGWYAAPPPAYAPPPNGYYGWTPPVHVFPDHPPDAYQISECLISFFILLFCNNVTVEFHGNDNPAFKGSKSGRMYLTTHRMIFNHKDSRDPLQSFSFPFVTISEVELEQPVFGANFIKGKVRAQPNGNWIGEVKFKLMFKSGGAIDFGQAMLKAAQMDAKAAEAAQSAYFDPNRPQCAYVPPPAYYEAPPTYQDATKKQQ